MNSERIGFYQSRIEAAYSEQTWTVAIVGATDAFVAQASKNVLLRIGTGWLAVAVIFVAVLGLAFVWSRHFIFMHYDGCIKEALGAAPADSKWPDDQVPTTIAVLARWSGVSLYSLIITGLSLAALFVLFSV